jgi:hypothetical protein
LNNFAFVFVFGDAAIDNSVNILIDPLLRGSCVSSSIFIIFVVVVVVVVVVVFQIVAESFGG